MINFFAELRMRSVTHLGQVRKIYQETSGDLSVFLEPADKVKPCLPIYPELLDKPITEIIVAGTYACIYCGNVQLLNVAAETECLLCTNHKWLPVFDEKITAIGGIQGSPKKCVNYAAFFQSYVTPALIHSSTLVP
jgi:uncharacterized membrane protein YcaP (DUF421 family)